MASNQELLSHLQALGDININDPNTNKQVNSKSLINVKTEHHVLRNVVLQLKQQPNWATSIIILNNLGCTYALLEDYVTAKQKLQQANALPDANETKRIVANNLAIVEQLPVPPILPLPSEFLERRRLEIEDNLQGG